MTDETALSGLMKGRDACSRCISVFCVVCQKNMSFIHNRLLLRKMHAYNEFAGGNHIRLRKPVLLTNTCLIAPIRIAQADWANTKIIFGRKKLCLRLCLRKK